MGKESLTPKKRPAKPFRGVIDGKSFTSTNQPTSEQKKKGWEEFRKQRLLTQEVIKMLIDENGTPKETFKGYLKSLLVNAKMGNPKAIDAINKCIEEDVIKVAQTNAAGEDLIWSETKTYEAKPQTD